VGEAGHPEWRLVLKSRQNNDDWNYDSAWWTNDESHNADSNADNVNIKTAAFFTARVSAVKIDVNGRTYIFSLPLSVAGTYTLKELVVLRDGLQMSAPGWRGSALDVFDIASAQFRDTQNRWYCTNLGFHYTQFFQQTIDNNEHCGAVSRIGALLSNNRDCQNINQVKAEAAEGLGLWNSCSGAKLGSGRLDGARKLYSPATVWVA